MIHHALKEQEASEQSARMNAMENATRNAGKIYLSLFNIVSSYYSLCTLLNVKVVGRQLEVCINIIELLRFQVSMMYTYLRL